MSTMATRTFHALYTKQKTQKAKKWQDGYVKMTEQKVILFDLQNKYLDSIFQRSSAATTGAEFEMEGFLVTLEAEKIDADAPLMVVTKPPAAPLPPKRQRLVPTVLPSFPQPEDVALARDNEPQEMIRPLISPPAVMASSPLALAINLGVPAEGRSAADILARFTKRGAVPPSIAKPAPAPLRLPPAEASASPVASELGPDGDEDPPAPKPSPAPLRLLDSSSLRRRVSGFVAPRSFSTLQPSLGAASVGSGVSAAPKRARDFKAPQLSSGGVNGWSHQGLCFPSVQCCQGLKMHGLVAPREISIPDSFPKMQAYINTMTSAVHEDINLQLLQLAQKFHKLLAHVPSLGKNGKELLCKHGKPAFYGVVKKEGPNKGRGFYTCTDRENRCDFWQWADAAPGSTAITSAEPLVETDIGALTKEDEAFLRSRGVAIYVSCTLQKQLVNAGGGWPRVPRGRVSAEGEGAPPKKKDVWVLQLENKEHYTKYSLDDLWVVSSQPTCAQRSPDDILFLARSRYHGPTQTGRLEIKPLGDKKIRLDATGRVYAIRAAAASSELAILDNLKQLTVSAAPIFPFLLGGPAAPCAPMSKELTLNLPEERINQLADEAIQEFKLNDDQALVLRSLSGWFQQPAVDPVRLVHGVFGSGKSHLLVVLVIFLSRLFDEAQKPAKILIASATNTAVDRVLLGLVQHGYTDFMRVGSVRKIAKPIFQHMCDTSASIKERIAELKKMLKSEELSANDKAYVLREIAEQVEDRQKERTVRLATARTVGVTCAAAAFPLLSDKTFHVVFLDECSQMIEPLSLLPLRFGCERLLCVGDPLQLPPTILNFVEGSGQDLSKTLFSRLAQCPRYRPVMLRTQYRCHPALSAIANKLFYQSHLKDGISASDRPPLVPNLPPLLFVDASAGKEVLHQTVTGSWCNRHEAEIVGKLIRLLADNEVKAKRIGIICLYKAQVLAVLDVVKRLFPETSKKTRKRRNDAEDLGLTAEEAAVVAEEAALFEEDPAEPTEEEVDALLATSGLDVLEDTGFDACDVQVSTVDSFQGAEREIIIVTCSRTMRVEGFIDSAKRLNVALTRARRHLIIVGHGEALAVHDLWRTIRASASELPGGHQQGADILAVDDFSELDWARTGPAPAHAPTPHRPPAPAPRPKGSQQPARPPATATATRPPPVSAQPPPIRTGRFATLSAADENDLVGGGDAIAAAADEQLLRPQWGVGAASEQPLALEDDIPADILPDAPAAPVTCEPAPPGPPSSTEGPLGFKMAEAAEEGSFEVEL